MTLVVTLVATLIATPSAGLAGGIVTPALRRRTRGNRRRDVQALHFRATDAARIGDVDRGFTGDLDLAVALRILTMKTLALPRRKRHLAPWERGLERVELELGERHLKHAPTDR